MNLNTNFNHEKMNREEAEKVCQLLAKNIDDFKFLVLSSMKQQEEESSRLSESFHSGVNRIAESEPKETLEEWVAREFEAKSPRRSPEMEIPGETLEEWVFRQPVKSFSSKDRRSLLGKVEQWIEDEIKNDWIKMIDAQYGTPEGLSSSYVRDLGKRLIALADKLEQRGQ